MFSCITRAPLQCAGLLINRRRFYIDGRVLGGAADREVTELDCSQVPKGAGEPEISSTSGECLSGNAARKKKAHAPVGGGLRVNG